MANSKVGRFSSSALKSLKAANPSLTIATRYQNDLLEPSLPIVMIRVGRGKNTTPFAIHKNVLEHCSPFFKSVWNPDRDTNTTHGTNAREDSSGSETESGWVRVPGTNTRRLIEFELDVNVAAFRLYAEWVYSGYIPQGPLRVNAEDVDFSTIGQAYILGEKLQDEKFRNAIVDLLLETIITQGNMDLTLPTLVFKETSASAPLRKLLVDLYVWYGHKDWLKPDGSKTSTSSVFLSDLSAAFFDRHDYDGVPKANILTLNACNYHEHPDGKVCSNGISHPREMVELGSEP
ncbi:uncharacterized protein M437DRAFT_38468 [Aureobasidium melanogenum CBS 110374]|uniref:BTB domain-containing protein n=1 Tax=Aureobasidium melanogenum (strain CBS 110374) TaxID=1043003 RepID=A0A074WZI9_AURM1|nr:uncharacterized protein M437DRAFT_38468 [Aureobasidium melanogenum CBS 110374]KEQ67836.1 hypothetical protein M437DRAFT_38468 [Aureobasidium melanogenum CBS 110374]